MSEPSLKINIERLVSSIRELGKCGALEGGGVCRLALSDEDKQGRDLVKSWMIELGLEVKIDAIGNMIGVRPGLEDGAPVMTGSHIDTVRTGGLYDGNLGVLAGLEVIACLNDAGIETRKPVAVGVFTNEEGARFAPDMMGSLVYVGGLELEKALSTVGIDGASVEECLSAIGYKGSEPVGKPFTDCFVELHVEQGPVLEEEGFAIGVVEQVQGISWTQYDLKGVSNHAGTTPMRLRQDAGFVAMSTGAYVRDLTKRYGGDQVATVGAIKFQPDLINVVPNVVRFTLDLRNTDNEILIKAEEEVFDYIAALAQEEGITFERKTLARFDPVDFDHAMIERVAHWSEKLGYSYKRMPSGAGHDAQMFARVCPTSMIFVPSHKGISHNIEEYTSAPDIERGANILLNMMVELAQEEWRKE